MIGNFNELIYYQYILKWFKYIIIDTTTNNNYIKPFIILNSQA